MATEPDILDLNILCPPPGEGYLEVRPVVSGRDLLAELTLRNRESGGPRFIGSGPRYLLGRGGRLHAPRPCPGRSGSVCPGAAWNSAAAPCT